MEVRPYGLNNNTVDRVYFIDKTQPMTAVIQRHKAPSTSVVIIDGKEYILKPTEPAPTTLKP